MAKLDSADEIHDDDDNQFCRRYLSRTSSIAGNGKQAGCCTVLLTNSVAILTRMRYIEHAVTACGHKLVT